jgi:hypothetical protein
VPPKIKNKGREGGPKVSPSLTNEDSPLHPTQEQAMAEANSLQGEMHPLHTQVRPQAPPGPNREVVVWQQPFLVPSAKPASTAANCPRAAYLWEITVKQTETQKPMESWVTKLQLFPVLYVFKMFFQMNSYPSLGTITFDIKTVILCAS